jgi:predicted nucleotidyltransferase
VQLDRPLQVVTPTVDGDVLAALGRADSAFTGRGLHRLIGRHSPDGVRRAVERLAGQGIVHVAIAGPSKLYSLNRDHLAAPHIVALARLREELLDRLRQRLVSWSVQPAYAALFGSAARGEMRIDSDIDVFIVRPNGVAADDGGWAEQLQHLAHDGSSWTGNDLRILEMSDADARVGSMGNEQVLSDIRDHGIRLAGPAAHLLARSTARRGRAQGD